MAFASNFGRILSPTFQPKSQAAAAGGWWDLDGTLTSCVAAYQPKGAASYSASLTDLSGNSRDATQVSAPGWDATNGWTNYDVTASLNTGVAFSSMNMSMIVRYANYDPSKSANYGVIVGDTTWRKSFYMSTFSQSRIYYHWGDGSVTKLSAGASAVIAMTKNIGYYNGSAVGTISPNYEGASNANIYVFKGNDAYLSILAFAIYSEVLTSTQVGLLTTAMNAL